MLAQKLATFLNDSAKEEKSKWGDREFFAHPPISPNSIVLNSNDYLGICAHPEILEMKANYLRNSKDSSLMSAAIMNTDCIQTEFEDKIAKFVGYETAILCQSGWAANVGLLSTICAKGLPIYIDRIAHMSLWEGARNSGSKITAFKHNNIEDLENKITEPGLIVVDSVYSTNGNLCPLKDLATLAKEKDCLLFVDESHSLGTHGYQGRGLVYENNLHDITAFVTCSLSKAFAARGGIICCPNNLKEVFKLKSYIAVFSSTVHSYEAAGFLKTLEVIQRDDWRRQRVHEVARMLRNGLRNIGYPVDSGTQQIIALEAGSVPLMLKLRDLLAENNILVAPFMPPATAADRSLCRITPTALITDTQIQKVLKVCHQIQPQLNIENWRTNF